MIYDGTGSANSSTKSTGPLAHPFATMRSNTSLTVLSMYGCIDLTFSGVNHDSTMPRCLICSGGSISTNVGRCLPAALPPSLNSGNPGRERSFDNLSSVATRQTSLYFVTSHAAVPSYNFTCESGSVARSRANSAGGSSPEARLNGKGGRLLLAVVEPMVVVVVADGLGVVVLRGRAVVRNVVVEVVVRARGRRVRAVDKGFREVRAAAVETRTAFMVMTWEGEAWWRWVLNGIIYTGDD
jgi:hypothetical protein